MDRQTLDPSLTLGMSQERMVLLKLAGLWRNCFDLQLSKGASE
jgi:hypothetical protein